ncbi:uncharacterized protein LOC129601863 [Paramacrobiotus metropolitanus]|uniref:uncharacterized protein LOC129601863 n=1 Tax=Paramacrobiotus metropolitanus TaxID=2943436 RepID=UPI002445A228|nr:uncharacterized protein LOC129601863 [Paramacrobiotus metropolitanus]
MSTRYVVPTPKAVYPRLHTDNDGGWKVTDVAATILYIAKQSGISDITLNKLLKVIAIIANKNRFPTEDSEFPDTVSKLKTMLDLTQENLKAVVKFMCPNEVQTTRVQGERKGKQVRCFSALSEANGKFVCECCGANFTKKEVNKDGNYFVTNPLQNILSTTMQQFGKYCGDVVRSETPMRDVRDGLRFQKINAGSDDLVIVMHSDGAVLSKSTNKKLYLMFTQCLNVPLGLRLPVWFLHTIWAGSELPKDRESFLIELVNQIKICQRNDENFLPIQWSDGENDHQSQVVLHSYIADTPERSAVSGQLSHSAKQSCMYCLQVGLCINHRICFPHDRNAELKTHEKLKEAAIIWETMNARQRKIALKEHLTSGMKRPTVLSQIQEFDLVEGFVLDVMHQFDEGVTKYLLSLLCELDSVLALTKAQKNEINRRWMRIIIPAHHNRPPRDIGEYKRMKAHELRFFMQHAAPFVLKDVLPSSVYEVFCHASRIIWLCTKEAISPTDVAELRDHCNQFLESFQTCFGISEMKYSVHLTQHIAYAVELFGPLHILSCYGPEHHIGKISRKVLAMQNTAKHIMNNSNTLTACAIKLNEARSSCRTDNDVREVICTVLGVPREFEFSEQSTSVNRCTFIGKASPVNVDHPVYRLLNDRLHRTVTASQQLQVFTFQRCRVENGIFVRTRAKNLGSSRNESIVITMGGDVIAVEYVIAIVNDESTAVCNSFVCGRLFSHNYTHGLIAGTSKVPIDHIFPVTLDEHSELALFDTKLISKQLVLLREPQNGLYIVSPPSNQFRLS